MLEAVWLLAAVEINGALVSRGANIQLSEHRCAVEAAMISPAVSPAIAKQYRQGEHWVINPDYCSYHEADNLLRIQLPQEFLAAKGLTLGDPTGDLSIALLHDPGILSQRPEFASQPTPRPLASAAFDLFLGSGLRGLGATLAQGPWSMQFLNQRSAGAQRLDRATAEYFSATGGQIRIGDFRTDYGAEQTFGEFRGLFITNRAAPLRGYGKAEANLAIRSPSRVQFFDRHGVAIYSSEILAPGNYQIQGYGASTVPGFLEARLIDTNGVTQSITLPWSADRKLLSHQQLQWEVFTGEPRVITGQLAPPPLHFAQVRYGASQNITAGLSAEWLGSDRRWALETSSRAIPNLIATAAAGQTCLSSVSCASSWLSEFRATLGRRFHALASVGRSIPLITPPTAGAQNAFTSRETLTAQLHLTGAISPRASGSVHLASTQSGVSPAQQIKTLAASIRLGPSQTLQLQARHHLLATEPAGWSGFVGLTFYFEKLGTAVGTYANFSANNSANTGRPGLTLQASRSTPGLYGPSIHIAHTEASETQSNAFMRYTSPYGDASLRADTQTDRAAWSAATRLWVTPLATTLAPAGDDNLVIQQVGLSSIKIRQPGRDVQTTNQEGLAIFKKAPAWTDSRYALDPKSIPFGFNIAAHQVRIPLAANRAYFIDFKGLWSRTQNWRIIDFPAFNFQEPILARDRFNRPIFIGGDGFVDLQSTDNLPISILRSSSETLICHLVPEQSARQLQDQENLECRSSLGNL